MAKRHALTVEALKVQKPGTQPPAASPAPEAPVRITTTLRIEPDTLERLKVIAHRTRGRGKGQGRSVNDLILEGVEHVLAQHKEG